MYCCKQKPSNSYIYGQKENYRKRGVSIYWVRVFFNGQSVEKKTKNDLHILSDPILIHDIVSFYIFGKSYYIYHLYLFRYSYFDF